MLSNFKIYCAALTVPIVLFYELNNVYLQAIALQKKCTFVVNLVCGLWLTSFVVNPVSVMGRGLGTRLALICRQ